MLKRVIFSILLAAEIGIAQTPNAYPIVGQQWYQKGFIPASSTAVAGATVLVNFGYFANTSGSAVTVTLTDQSTDCGASTCQFWPVISIAANTVYTVSFGGFPAVGGLKWTASTGSVVVGYLTGTYTLNLTAENQEWDGMLAANVPWRIIPDPKYAAISVYGATR
jgi:hypothetical protein